MTYKIRHLALRFYLLISKYTHDCFLLIYKSIDLTIKFSNNNSDKNINEKGVADELIQDLSHYLGHVEYHKRGQILFKLRYVLNPFKINPKLSFGKDGFLTPSRVVTIPTINKIIVL